MGMVAVSAGASSPNAFSALLTPAIGTGGIFVTAVLTYLLGYLNVVSASERNLEQVRSLLVVAVLPLLVVFLSIVLFESLRELRFI